MKENCIVCAKEFDNPNMERLTCSEECKQKWAEFLVEIKRIPKEKRKEEIDKFLTPYNIKMIVSELRK